MSDGKPNPESIIALEVDGEGVSVEKVDAPLLLEIAASFFALVQGNAKDAKKDLVLQGISITNKCVQVAATTNDPTTAQFFVQKSHMQISGDLPASRGLTDLIKRAQTALKRAPSDWAVMYKAGSWSKKIELAPKKVRPMRELITLRATVDKLTGKPHAYVRLSSQTEGREFTLKAKKNQIRRLGKVILSEIDLQAFVHRDAEGVIEGGRLIDFEPVNTAADAIAEWTEWYNKNAAEWDTVEDIEGELRARTN